MATPAMPVVTALYGGLNAIFNVFLASRVARARGRNKVSIGLGDSKDLLLHARVHANNAEFVPLALVIMLLAELCGASSMALHVIGGSLLVARVLHMVGMPRPAPNFFRVTGAGGTWLIIVGASIYLFWLRMHSGQ
jgi:uncharacterized membrane protein YecN with MAPEG domain